MLQDLGFLNKDVCMAIAQIIPVLFIALVAERILLPEANSVEGIPWRKLLAVTVRLIFDLAIAVGLIFLLLLALTGVQRGGLYGSASETLWVGTVTMMGAMLYRWLLLATPLLAVLQLAERAINEIARAVTAFFDALIEAADGIFKPLLAVLSLVLKTFSLGLEALVIVLSLGINGVASPFKSFLSVLTFRRGSSGEADDGEKRE